MTLGRGPTPILTIAGAGDGLRTVYDAAATLAWYFRQRISRYSMLLISRHQPIPPYFTVEQHANDYLWAMEQLGWGSTFIECNSGGGPIGQWIAVKRPDLVRGLILSSTFCHTTEHVRAILKQWIYLAHEHKWSELNWSSITYTFRPQTVTRYRLLRLLLHLMPPPRYAERLERMLEGLLAVDNRETLTSITCPTLVIDGAEDRIFGPELQYEMANLIPDSHLRLYQGYGHGNDQENPDYNVQVDLFIEDVQHS